MRSSWTNAKNTEKDGKTMNGILTKIFRNVLPAILLMASAPAADAWAKSAGQAEQQYVPDTSKAQILEYTNETVVVPYRWTAENLTKNLIRANFVYQKKPDSTCSSRSIWADFTIQTDIAPCMEMEEQSYDFVRTTLVDTVPGRLYRAKKTSGEETGILPGGSLLKLTVNRYKRCYIMTFNTCEKWVPRFFPDFMLIINNFKAYKKAADKPSSSKNDHQQAGTAEAEGSAFID